MPVSVAVETQLVEKLPSVEQVIEFAVKDGSWYEPLLPDEICAQNRRIHEPKSSTITHSGGSAQGQGQPCTLPSSVSHIRGVQGFSSVSDSSAIQIQPPVEETLFCNMHTVATDV